MATDSQAWDYWLYCPLWLSHQYLLEQFSQLISWRMQNCFEDRKITRLLVRDYNRLFMQWMKQWVFHVVKRKCFNEEMRFQLVQKKKSPNSVYACTVYILPLCTNYTRIYWSQNFKYNMHFCFKMSILFKFQIILLQVCVSSPVNLIYIIPN